MPATLQTIGNVLRVSIVGRELQWALEAAQNGLASVGGKISVPMSCLKLWNFGIIYVYIYMYMYKYVYMYLFFSYFIYHASVVVVVRPRRRFVVRRPSSSAIVISSDAELPGSPAQRKRRHCLGPLRWGGSRRRL